MDGVVVIVVAVAVDDDDDGVLLTVKLCVNVLYEDEDAVHKMAGGQSFTYVPTSTARSAVLRIASGHPSQNLQASVRTLSRVRKVKPIQRPFESG